MTLNKRFGKSQLSIRNAVYDSMN